MNSWRCPGGSKASSWKRLGGSLRRLALGEPWGRLGRTGGGPGGVLGGPGVGGSLGRLGAVLGALEAMLETSGGQKAPKIEPKRVPIRAPEVTRAENDETLNCNDSTKDFNDVFKAPRVLLGRETPLQRPHGRHLEAS